MSTSNDDDRKLEDEICSRGGFFGCYLDEETVALLERKLEEQNMGMEVFYFVAIDRDGHSTLMVPVERAQAASFVTEAKAFADAFAEAFRETGECGQVEEIEQTLVSRFKRQEVSRHVVKTASRRHIKLFPGDRCIPTSAHIKSKKKKKP